MVVRFWVAHTFRKVKGIRKDTSGTDKLQRGGKIGKGNKKRCIGSKDGLSK